MAGTGLPIPKDGDVRAQTPNVVSMDAGAREWGRIAAAGEKLAGAGLDTLALSEHQARTGYLADQEVDIGKNRAELRDKNSFNPKGFEADWNGYTEGKLREAAPWAVDHLKRTLGQSGNAAYAAILNETRARDTRLQGESVASLVNMSGNEVIGSAMAGTLRTPEGAAKVQKYQAVLQSAVTSGLHPQEWADAHLEDTLSKAEGEIAARDGMQVYREKGFDAAVDHLRKNILENESLTLKQPSKYQAFSRGLSAIRLQQAEDKKDREEVVTVSRDLRARLESNQPVDPSEVRDTLGALQKSGAAAEFHRLSVSSSVAAATAPYRSGLSLREFAGAVSMQRTGLAEAVKRFEGYEPNAKFDFRQYSVGYGTRATSPNETIDRGTAEARLNQELGSAAATVDKAVPNLPKGVRDAMISLTFNAGADWVNAGLGDRLRAGDYQGAKQLFLQYNKAGGQVNEGLANRRAQEVQWFDRPEGAGEAGDVPVGVPFAGEVTKRVQQVFVGQARKAWPDFKRLIDNGKVLDLEDFNSIRYAAALSGDSNWQQEVEALATANKIGSAVQRLPEAQRQGAIDQLTTTLRDSGIPIVDQETITQSLTKQFERQNKQVREDPVGYAIEQGAKPPAPLDFRSAEAAAAGIADRVRIARGVAAQQETAPGMPFRPAERAAMAGAIGSGDARQAGVALDAIANLPDEFLTPTLNSPDIKAAIAGAARSGDAVRYNGAMAFMDRVWARAPELAKHAFGEDNIHALMTWQSNSRYMSGDQLAKERERLVADPQARRRREIEEKEGTTEARKYDFADVVKQFDNSWWITPGPLARATGSQPLAPTDPMTRQAMMGDFETLYARRYAETLDKDIALKQTIDLMKTKWTASPVNGGRLMLNAPETVRGPDGKLVYPPVAGSWDWMNKQLEEDIGRELGKPMNTTSDVGASQRNWTYTIVPDRQTGAEAQAGQPASYNIVVTDAESGRSTVLPRRYSWSRPEGELLTDSIRRQTDFEQQRARVTEPPRSLLGEPKGMFTGQPAPPPVVEPAPAPVRAPQPEE